ncbi:MAG TPA: non-ribosomal peptide synthetase [Candidatus Angelobacter sp.]
MDKSLVRTANSFCYLPGSQFETIALPTEPRQTLASDRFVPHLVSDQARQNPGRIALVDDSTQMTYGQLDDRANRLADQLKGLGAGANTVVAVCMRRSSLTVLASLAALKSGAAYLPIDPTYPQERLSFILTDANAPIVLSDSTVADSLPAGSWRLVLLDSEDLRGSAPITWQTSQICPDQLAYVIYTSGSTGTPKGVEITHANLLNLVFWHQKAFAVTAEDRATQFASFGFDAAVWEIWPHLAAGAAVHIIPNEVRTSPELLEDWLVAQEITISFVPTALAERLITRDWPANTRLRFLLTGADTLHHYPRPGLPFALINNYGPTEATVVATSGRVDPENAHSGQRPPIGQPIDGTEIYIVDESLNPVSRSEVGELCIGGAGVARGYVNSPELTAKKFVPDPFAEKQGARLYRTGDLARWLPDGQIEYIGRVDNLIKIRGYRIEPNEIVSVLNTHPAVQASAVVAREDGTRNLRLLAYLVISQTQISPNASELRKLLRTRLPDYMVPAVFLEIPELPINANGKLDREALPSSENTKTLPDDDYVTPHTGLEEKLSAVVSELLGVERVGANDNFFLIGGHSLFGTQLIARIRDSFGVELPLRSVFESPTPALLAQQVEGSIVAKLETMSEDEVQRVLEQATSGGGLQ